MSLHPDERPQDIEAFRQALLGDKEPITRPRAPIPNLTLLDVMSFPAERALVWVSVGLLLLSLAITILR